MRTGVPPTALLAAAGFAAGALINKYVQLAHTHAHTCPTRPVFPSPLQAAGFTVSPLMSKYVQLAGGESQESLVTLVLKADMGGLLSGGRGEGWMRWLGG